ncbi:MAG: hypothetical protein IPI67_35420 [Myxococcales bacterium]|nr:hypothetical protein [Myxococcales bacterium]
MKRLVLSMFATFALACGSDDAEVVGSGGTASGGTSATGGATTGGAGGTSSGGASSGGASSGGSGGGAAGTTTGGSGGSAGAPDCLTKAQGVEVADVDLDGFPSYSVDGCQLAYVSAKNKTLILRDLASGSETEVALAAESPRRPSLAGDVLTWEADVSGKGVVRVRNGGATTTLSGGFDHAGEPRATTDAVVFTGWTSSASDGDTEVFLYSTSTKAVTLVAGGKGQQRFADVSMTHVAISDFSEDPSGTYAGDGTTLANIIVVDRKTLDVSVRKVAGKQAFPMLGSSGSLAYLEWVTVHPVPKLQEYTIRAVPITTLMAPGIEIASVQSEQAVRPTAHAGVAEWVVRWSSQSTLWRAELDGSKPPLALQLGSIEVLHAPSSASSMTVLAVRKTAASAPALLAIPR